MDFSIDFDAKAVLSLLNIKKYRDALSDYISSMEKFLELKSKLQNYIDFENKTVRPCALFLSFDEDEKLTTYMLEFNNIIDEITEKQNKLNELGKSIMMISDL